MFGIGSIVVFENKRKNIGIFIKKFFFVWIFLFKKRKKNLLDERIFLNLSSLV